MLEVILLSFALSMDAFAVSIGLGVKNKYFDKTLALKVALFFGFFKV
jgi:putative Mn2+ efflux pump MntP